MLLSIPVNKESTSSGEPLPREAETKKEAEMK